MSKPSVSVTEAIREHSVAFTSADKKIVRALQDDYPRAGLESLPKLAARANVSAPTVLRLLAKIGYPGYGEFQTALHDEVTARMSAPTNRHAPPEVSDGDVVLGNLSILAESVSSTARRIDSAEFDAVVDLLTNTKRPVSTFGGFESEVCANHLATLLSQVRSGVRFQTRGSTSAVFEALDIKRQSVVIAFDFRRYQTSTLSSVRFAKDRGATVILFTDRWISPAADFAEHVFVCDSHGVGRFDSRVSCIALIEAIVAEATSRLGLGVEQRIAAVYELLSGSTWAETLPEDANMPSDDTEIGEKDS
ncbi:MurR/RpiR family transcriptional regulator [Rhodococcus globerulus]|uniref:MurR/RpiR family transcriptional regulator n=1 Tax=Rhodococcus globerulus TaxID=33008 RepID=UPI001061113F|nr:MurR/RpiR family transcriptional regulator [Rhodococcus globerulus]